MKALRLCGAVDLQYVMWFIIRCPCRLTSPQDIWKGRMGDTLICIKVLRMFVNNGIEERARVIKVSFSFSSSLVLADVHDQNFCREALVWRNLKHPNVLLFLGVSTELFVPSFCLIYPWMENGNIMKFLATNPGHNRLVSVK